MSQTIPLTHAALCLDCDSVVDGRAGTCPRCNGRWLHPLSKWIPTLIQTPQAPTPESTAGAGGGAERPAA